MGKYRPGSAGAAEEKMERNGIIVFSIIQVIIALIFIVPSNHCTSLVGFFNYYFKQASTFWNVTAIISTLAYVFVLVKCFRKLINEEGQYVNYQTILLFGWVAINFFLYAGFNFPLPPCDTPIIPNAI